MLPYHISRFCNAIAHSIAMSVRWPLLSCHNRCRSGGNRHGVCYTGRIVYFFHIRTETAKSPLLFLDSTFMDTPHTILAIIDNPTVGTTVRQALDASDLLVAQCTLAHGSDVPALLTSAAYDCVLLDAAIPAAGMQETLCAIRKARPQPAVVALLPPRFEPFASDTWRPSNTFRCPR